MLKLLTFIQSFVNNDQNVILSQETYASVIDAQASANNSESLLDKDFINAMVESTQVFQGKNVQQVKELIAQ